MAWAATSDGILVLLGALLALGLALAERIGSFIFRRLNRIGRAEEAPAPRIGHVLTSTFGLLALLVGFSFGIALNRYDTRRSDVVAEANAISTAHYRASFVADEYGAALRARLIAYARHRLAYGRAGPLDRPGLERIAVHLRRDIADAGKSLKPVAQTPLGASIVASINEVLDLGVQREANMRAQMPSAVFAVLIGLALLGAGTMGFAYPLAGVMRQGSSLVLFCLLATVIAVILDLDRPARGSVTVDQSPMEQLTKEFGLLGDT